MATKKCINGHQYDASIYGDNCPFCPSHEATAMIPNGGSSSGGETAVIGHEAPTIPMNEGAGGGEFAGGGTVIRRADGQPMTGGAGGKKKLVGVLISYSVDPMGEVYKIYEGRNIIGRAPACDIAIPSDENMSGQHLLILYVEAEGIVWAEDQKSSNGTYINGKFSRGMIELHTNDQIVIGGTKFIFFQIPR